MKNDLFEKVNSSFNLVSPSYVFHGYNSFRSINPEESKKRHQEWRKFTNQNRLWPTEFLLSRIHKDIKLELPPFMKDTNHKKYSRDFIQNKVNELGPWGYYFQLDYEIPTKLHQQGKNNICFRSKLISETVEEILGDELFSCSVLDLASNSGFFSFDLTNRGAKFVEGVELRKHNFEQAQFLKEYYQADTVEFFNDDIFKHNFRNDYDVVLMLGLLYHVTNPIEMIRMSYDLCNKITVIDTICHKEPISAYHVMMNKDVTRHGEGKYTVEFHPTYRAVIDSMYDAGFKHILEVTGNSDVDIKLYSDYVRRCFIGFK